MKTLTVNDIINESCMQAGLKNEEVAPVMESATVSDDTQYSGESNWITESIMRAIPSSFAAGLGAVAMRDRFKETMLSEAEEPKKEGFFKKHGGKVAAGVAGLAGAGALAHKYGSQITKSVRDKISKTPEEGGFNSFVSGTGKVIRKNITDPDSKFSFNNLG